VHFTRFAGEEAIAGLADQHLRIVQAAAKGEPSLALLAEAQAVDWGFHDALIDFLDNEIISNVYKVNSMKIRLISLERVRLSPRVLQPAFDEHGAILDAIRARNPERALAAMDRHITSARNRALGLALAEPPPMPVSARPSARPSARRQRTGAAS
jgi:DNA-binding GntR family transcriptional regulator